MRMQREFLLTLLALVAPTVQATPLDAAAVAGFASDMAAAHAFDAAEVRALLARVSRQDSALAAISRPAEYKPWYRYRPIFLTEARIAGGRDFWALHASALAEVSAASGVPAEIIVAIIGVETAYGANAGNYRVLDALATLAFHYPPRASFFRSELENFLQLARDEGVDPAVLKGSYAGAMGIPQFMPSSFRAYAVDGDADGRRDIWTNPRDALGSVANYLRRHGWESGQPIAMRALESPENSAQVSKTVELDRTLTEYAALGVRPDGQAPAGARAVLLAFEGEHADEFWIGLRNFYVITRYNRSPKYALAVFQLGEAIREARAGVQP
jgi:membrane-bound lytic murein transglycosylase B